MNDFAWCFLAIAVVSIMVAILAVIWGTEVHIRSASLLFGRNPLQEIKEEIGKLMALVQVDQTDLDKFASTVETEVAAIGAAVGVIQTYIQQLIAGQATPLPAADESAITTALSDLSTSVGSLNSLEPVTPTPTPPTPSP